MYKRQLSDSTSTGWGRLSLPPDPNLRDNHLYFTYGPQKPQLTTIVHDGSLSQVALKALTRAAAPPGFDSLQLSLTELSGSNPEISALDLSQTTFLIWAAPLPSDTAAVLVRSYLESGGQVLFLPTTQAQGHSFASLSWNPLELSLIHI